MFDNLKDTPAEAFAEAIKGKPDNLGCKTAFDLLFIAPSRFNSINSFRESLINGKTSEIEKIQSSPIMLLEPARVISHRKFKYALELCPTNPNKR
jgi:hypothetical protein